MCCRATCNSQWLFPVFYNNQPDGNLKTKSSLTGMDFVFTSHIHLYDVCVSLVPKNRVFGVKSRRMINYWLFSRAIYRKARQADAEELYSTASCHHGSTSKLIQWAWNAISVVLSTPPHQFDDNSSSVVRPLSARGEGGPSYPRAANRISISCHSLADAESVKPI